MLTFTKFTSVALSALLLVPAAVASLTYQSGLTDITESSCNAITNKKSCYQQTDDDTGTLCEWCVAEAIPIECMSQEQAKQLPTAVYQCSAPDTGFDFAKGNKRHSLKVTNVDADFCDSSSTGKSGYMNVKGSDYDTNGEHKHFFFWMYEKRGEVADDTPFVVWLTGGPGCSSTIAFLWENGPCLANMDGVTTTVNPYSWTEAAHVLWLDQPAGVGFSYGAETVDNGEMVGEDGYYFLQTFFQTYPEYASKPLFIVGESYGGHFAPAIAHRVWRGNQENKEGTIQLKLSGIAIGNGLVDPKEQYKWYPEMVFHNSHNIEAVNETIYNTMKAAVGPCITLIEKCNSGDSFLDNIACQSAFLFCNVGPSSQQFHSTGLNPYDIRTTCDNPPLCYDFSHLQKFLNLDSTKKALGVDEKHSHTWATCNFRINSKFHKDWMKSYTSNVADLLNDGIPALVYAGDVDFICNYLGVRAWTLGLEWNGKYSFNGAPEHSWKDQGLARSAEGLTFLQVYDAGHMAPHDQPKIALDMITNFVQGGAF